MIGRAAAARELAQMGPGEALVEGLEAEAGGEEALELIGAFEQLAGTEAARVDDEQFMAGPSPELDPDARVDRLLVGVQEDGPGHAQVLGEVKASAELPEQVLAAPLEALHTASAQRRGELGGRQRSRPALVEHLDLGERASGDHGRELAADRLDLGELGHR